MQRTTKRLRRLLDTVLWIRPNWPLDALHESWLPASGHAPGFSFEAGQEPINAAIEASARYCRTWSRSIVAP
jgi:hypothetical protein